LEVSTTTPGTATLATSLTAGQILGSATNRNSGSPSQEYFWSQMPGAW
jgi:hypothetical protein